jgi:hypothetical protein
VDFQVEIARQLAQAIVTALRPLSEEQFDW